MVENHFSSDWMIVFVVVVVVVGLSQLTSLLVELPIKQSMYVCIY